MSVGASSRWASGGVMGSLSAVAVDIKLSHTVFALPFALLGTFLAAGWARRLPGAAELLLILACMVLARTAAMAMNRWADAWIDGRNPRTAGRVVPSGRVSRRFMLGVALACAAGLWAGAWMFDVLWANPWPGLLTPAVLVVLLGYSFTKRFTWACHAVLGLALGLSPLAAAAAIQPGYLQAPAPYLIAGLVLGWVAGFDVIYALQDAAVDRAQGIFSIPAAFGDAPGLWLSRSLHAGAAACAIALAVVSPQLHGAFACAAGLAVALLALEHALVWGSTTHRIHHAFFTVNGVISLLLGAAGIFDVVVGVRG